MTEGDKVQYNKVYKPEEVVAILRTLDRHALIQFQSGTKIATPLTGLWSLKKDNHPTEATLKEQEEKKDSE
jgi:hypothetical protein